MLQEEKEQQREQHEQTVQKLLAKHEADVSHLHQEHALSASKVPTNLKENQPISSSLHIYLTFSFPGL